MFTVPLNTFQVELPSQFMENWLYDKTTMNLVSGHYRTNETLPDELFQQVVKGRLNSLMSWEQFYCKQV